MQAPLPQIDRDELLDRALDRIETVLDQLGLDVNTKTSDRTKLRVGRGQGSLVIELDGPKAGMWHDFGGGHSCFGQAREGGDLVHLIGAFTPGLSRYGEGIRELDRILGGNGGPAPAPRRRPKPARPAAGDDLAARRAVVIELIEKRATPIDGTPAETYLKARGLDPERPGVRDALAAASKTLRFVDNARNYSGKWYHEGPALCLMGRDSEDGGVTNLQQVFLSEDGAGKLDRNDPEGRPLTAKKSLGQFVNPARLPGGSDADGKHVALVEGPENGLTFRAAEDVETLIAFGASGLRRVELGDGVRHVTLVSDGDLPASKADESFRDLSRHLRCEGYWVREVRPETEGRKRDLNDVLREEGPEAVEALVSGSKWFRPYPAMSIEEGQKALEGVTGHLIESQVFRANELVRARSANPEFALDEVVRFAKNKYSDEKEAIAELEKARRDYAGIPKDDAGRVEWRFMVRFQNGVIRAVGEVARQLREDGSAEGLVRAVRSAHDELKMAAMAPDQAKRAAKKRFDARMAEVGLEPQAPTRLVLGSPGLGKTRSISSMIRAADPDAVIWVLQPRTDKAEECVEEIREGLKAAEDDRLVMQVRGRGAANPEAADPKETICLRADAAERIAQIGRPVSSTLCRKVWEDEYGEEVEEVCPFYANCAYIKQREALRAHEGGGVFVMTHAALSGPSDAPRPDLVVVDEDPSQGMVKQYEVGADRLKVDGLVEAYLHAAVDDEACVAATPEAIEGADELLRAVGQAVRNEAPLPALVRNVDAGRLRELARALVAAEDRLTQDIGPETDDGEIVDLLQNAARTEMRRLARVLESVAKETDLAERMTAAGVDVGEARPTLNGVRYEADAEREVEGAVERVSRVTAHRLGTVGVGKRVPVIVLDGTADSELLRRALGRQVATDRIEVRRQGELQQIIGRSFSSDSLSGKNAFAKEFTKGFKESAEKLQGLVASMLEKEAKKAQNGVFVCAPLRVENAFVKAEDAEKSPSPVAQTRDDWEAAGVHWAHFGATRGMNAWQDCETAVLVGRKQLPPSAAVDLARAFYAEDEAPIDVTDAPGEVNAYQKVTRKLHDKHGRATEVTATEHADPRVQRVLWQHREAEMIQAMDRVRATRHPRRIVLLNELDLRRPDDDPEDPGAGVPADAVVPWDIGLDAGTRTGRLLEALGGVLPVSPTYLHKSARDQFPSVEGAKSWLRRVDLEGSVHKYNSIYQATPLKFFRVRVEGQRGKPLRTLVDTRRFKTMEDAKNAAANVLGGNVVLFEPETTEEDMAWGDAAREKHVARRAETGEETRPEAAPEQPFEAGVEVEPKEAAEIHRHPALPEPAGPMPEVPKTARLWRETKYGRWLVRRKAELTELYGLRDDTATRELAWIMWHEQQLDAEDAEHKERERAENIERIERDWKRGYGPNWRGA